MTDRAPNFPGSQYPGAAPRNGVAWQAAWEMLGAAGKRWTARQVLMSAMADAGGILPHSAGGLLYEAKKHGFLEQKLSKRGRTRYAAYRRADLAG